MIDLAAYCARIGHAGPLTPTLATLRALQALHPAAIPFEAIDVLLDRGVDLAPTAVEAKLIAARRGGYCFEQNGLFRRVLTAIGFEVESLVARVRWMLPPGALPTARSHMVLRVTIDGDPWLVDVGFGSCVPTAPLRMDTSGPQSTPHESYRLVPSGDALLLQAQLEDSWADVYQIAREPQLDIDYEVANWFTATHPSSHFRHRLIVARTTPQARYVLLENRLTIRTPDGRAERRFLDAGAIEQALVQTFGLPVEASWRPVIERAAAAVV
jgi:N-hydroxyarylamine O-acetyltransferase